jgi:hypothetical protein
MPQQVLIEVPGLTIGLEYTTNNRVTNIYAVNTTQTTFEVSATLTNAPGAPVTEQISPGTYTRMLPNNIVTRSLVNTADGTDTLWPGLIRFAVRSL